MHSGVMTVDGFRQMLRSHGLTKDAKILGITCKDEFCFQFSREVPQVLVNGVLVCPHCNKHHSRAEQIQYFLFREVGISDFKYVILDDNDFGFTTKKLNFVYTSMDKGLQDNDVEECLKILGVK